MNEIVTGIGFPIVVGVVNFVANKVYTQFTGDERSFFWKKKIHLIDHFDSRTDLEELKKRLKIVVIDDHDIFPVQPFTDAGYSIERWNTVKDYSKLESGAYDIIVLDIFDVAQHLSEDDGLGVLDSLKKKNPAQIIIAYSGHSFDLSKQRFWDLADEKIVKPSSFLRIKDVMDNVVNQRFTLKRYWEVVLDTLEEYNVDEKAIGKIETLFVNALSTGRELNWGKVAEIVHNQQLIIKLMPVGNLITKNFRKK
ncbi:hypothetical protein IC235_18725 [Hymenobacter sp. BT664]|uniref:Response regulator n=1 Tax=Hymenobacter montanus TaxID=2771359 RepID=A0A927GL85_9BACT|nr:hypothetical protein [Hymenobacter montanus]MBD2769929.1 hypothetical protein [Hymenobacter montanus]